MSSTITTPTLKIATARLEFSRDRRLAQTLHAVAVAALVALVALVGRQLHADAQASSAVVEGVQRQNAELRADLSRARIELELERSTRAALERQVAELNEETSALKSRLEFFNAQSGRQARTR
ncbi:MAG TPA: hypothetical protein VFI92_01120 [Steroidobacteraceae bacterium]|nr:hypothetical protein [Steroidobacteraceae bacterium]